MRFDHTKNSTIPDPRDKIKVFAPKEQGENVKRFGVLPVLLLPKLKFD